MTARSLVVASALLAIACSNAAGAPDETAPAGTTTPLFQGFDVYDAIAARDGFVYVEVPGAGVQRCPTSGCAAPTPVVASDAFVSSTLGDVLTYATQIAADDGSLAGEIHSVGADGSDDRILLADASYPAYVATSGARTFWASDSFAVDDTPFAIQCIGCGSTPWIMSIAGATYGMIADAHDVYVLADDASLESVSLLSCSVDAPCFGEPRVVLGGLDRTATAQQLASDGTNVYVARPLQNDVVRVDRAGVVTPVVTSQAVSAVAYDASTASVYWGTTDGDVGRVPADGSSAPTKLAFTGSAIAALAVDDAGVYFVTGPSGSEVLETAK
jgi:hypothetical protein